MSAILEAVALGQNLTPVLLTLARLDEKSVQADHLSPKSFRPLIFNY